MSHSEHAVRRIQAEHRGGGVLVLRLPGDRLGLLGREDAAEFLDLIATADRDPAVRAVVLTGSHPGRFISHADLAWLQQDGSVIPPLGRRLTSLVVRLAHALNRFRPTRSIARKTLMTGAIQLDQMHKTLSSMTTSSTIFVAALNGSALGLGAEISWACDLRIMAEGDYVIGHVEVLLGFAPGAGGTQRLPRLIGSRRAMVAMLEGRPFTGAEALAVGAIDEIVPADQLVARAVERATYLAARPAAAIGAVKRAVNVGATMPIAEGLHLERTEFLASLPQAEAQQIMLAYLADTAVHGELPVYRTGGYAEALQRGTAVGRSPQDGAGRRGASL